MSFEIFIQTDEKYNTGLVLDEYNGIFSLVSAFGPKGDFTTKLRWGFPQKKEGPAEKAIPWKITLGNRREAVEILTKIINELQVQQ